MKFGNREGEKNPPKELADKPLPEWTPAERKAYEPPGRVWNRDRQEWTD